MPNQWQDFFNRKLQLAKKSDCLRQLDFFDTLQPGYLMKGETRYLNLCANDYLGLAAEVTTHDEAKLLSEILPVGSGASRLITGSLIIHQELEKLLAEWKGTQSALVYPSGYQTNVGLISCLGCRGDAIFSDKFNHASLIDGIKLSEAKFIRYAHNDFEALEKTIKETKAKRRIIVTDGVFSMDGDIAPLPELNELAKKYDALLIVDEAHATGVIGNEGAGSWSYYGLPWEEHVILMGTLSKGVGSQGGFICASKQVIDYLTNHSRSFIYSTALSPILAAIAHFNIARIRCEADKRERLHENSMQMRQALNERHIPVRQDPTPIIPIIVRENQLALQIAKALKDEHIIALAIRPPTVAENSARIRISISAAHHPDDLHNAANLISHLVNEQIEVTS